MSLAFIVKAIPQTHLGVNLHKKKVQNKTHKMRIYVYGRILTRYKRKYRRNLALPFPTCPLHQQPTFHHQGGKQPRKSGPAQPVQLSQFCPAQPALLRQLSSLSWYTIYITLATLSGVMARLEMVAKEEDLETLGFSAARLASKEAESAAPHSSRERG